MSDLHHRPARHRPPPAAAPHRRPLDGVLRRLPARRASPPTLLVGPVDSLGRGARRRAAHRRRPRRRPGLGPAAGPAARRRAGSLATAARPDGRARPSAPRSSTSAPAWPTWSSRARSAAPPSALAQAVVLRPRLGRRRPRLAGRTSPRVWAAGWAVTTAVGVAGRRAVHRLRLQRRRRRHRAHRRPARSPSTAPQPEERVMSRHVVFGTGQVGRLVVEQLVARGVDVVAVNRNGDGRPPRRPGRRRRRHRPGVHHPRRAPAPTSSTSASTR